MSNSNAKVAIITGGARGIGRAIVLELASQGYSVAFNFKSSHKVAAELEQEVQALNATAKGYAVDIGDGEAVKQWIERVKQDFRRIDVLVNNAGIIRDKALMMMTFEDWQSVLDTNLNGMFYAARACIVSFLKQKSGKILNISSVSGVSGMARQTNYSASKGGMNAFTRSLAKEVAAYGITVNALCPGFIETDMLRGLNEKQRQEFQARIPLARFGNVDDVAKTAAFLLSEEAAYITGQIIQVDGGLNMRF
ncbi:MAG: 3-oxoacyl-ACP reductase FabG [Candidatus Omnitrophica bacterium]|nr:3-oxoacyl-ACP reductase FabG [Candidatus Omnitrophota bacterium]